MRLNSAESAGAEDDSAALWGAVYVSGDGEQMQKGKEKQKAKTNERSKAMAMAKEKKKESVEGNVRGL